MDPIISRIVRRHQSVMARARQDATIRRSGHRATHDVEYSAPAQVKISGTTNRLQNLAVQPSPTDLHTT